MIKTDSRGFLPTALAEIKKHLGEAHFNVDRLSRKLGPSRMQLHTHMQRVRIHLAIRYRMQTRFHHQADFLPTDGCDLKVIAFSLTVEKLAQAGVDEAQKHMLPSGALRFL